MCNCNCDIENKIRSHNAGEQEELTVYRTWFNNDVTLGFMERSRIKKATTKHSMTTTTTTKNQQHCILCAKPYTHVVGMRLGCIINLDKN